MVPLFSLSDGYLLGMLGWIVAGIAALVLCLKLRRRWRADPRRVRWTSFALSCWFLLAALTAVELSFALFVDRTDSFDQTNISKRWRQLHVRTNAEGYRDTASLKDPLAPGQKRIVLVGDSFTFGHGVEVEERFSDRIAASLSETHPGRFAVANVSLPGLDTRQIVDQVVPEILSSGHRADVLIYTFVLNDIEYFDERTGQFYQALASSNPEFFLFRDTYFFNLMWYRLQAVFRPESRDYYGYLKESYEGEPWKRLESKLDELIAMCRSRKVELRIVVFPFLQNLGREYPFHEAHRRLVAYFESRGVPCLDLEPALEPHAGERLTVNASDAHPNPRAHSLAAEAIVEALLNDLLR